MLKRTLPFLLTTAVLTGCAAQSITPEKAVTIGDPSGHTQIVALKQQDIANACNLTAFEDGFKYTYMSMWNSHLEAILEKQPEQRTADHYSTLFFNAKPNTRAALDEDPAAHRDYNYCQESSYQQGKISGFMYAIEDLKKLEEKPSL